MLGEGKAYPSSQIILVHLQSFHHRHEMLRSPVKGIRDARMGEAGIRHGYTMSAIVSFVKAVSDHARGSWDEGRGKGLSEAYNRAWHGRPLRGVERGMHGSGRVLSATGTRSTLDHPWHLTSTSSYPLPPVFGKTTPA